jgi:uncharacterized protein (DUF924 family)
MVREVMVRGGVGMQVGWREVYDFWFPDELRQGRLGYHLRMSDWWMKGGASPELPPFAPCLEAAAGGELDFWAGEPLGRLALIVVLDQFPRGLFADTRRAYAQDAEALRLCREGLANGHYAALRYPWEQFFFTLPIIHAEGPDHLERLQWLVERLEEGIPVAAQSWPELGPLFDFSLSQARANVEVIGAFGRFPHRNAILGRQSTPEELAYVAEGDFVHLRRRPWA